MGCCGCFGFTRKPKPRRLVTTNLGSTNHLSQELLLDDDIEDADDGSYNGDATNTINGDDGELQSRVKRFEEILRFGTQNGIICREFPVKETHKVIRIEVANPVPRVIHPDWRHKKVREKEDKLRQRKYV